MPPLKKLLGLGLGLGSEAIHKARESKSSTQSSNSNDAPSNPPPYSAPDGAQYTTGSASAVDHFDDHQRTQAHDADHHNSFGHDEMAWELDDMVESMSPAAVNEQPNPSADSEDAKIEKREKLVRELVSMAGPAPKSPRPLPCPVIIPQRRPRKKDRGFVRAYAPVLANSGISQEVFMQFLENLDKANKASAWIEVVYVASGIAGMVPNMAVQVTTTVISVIAGTARELQVRHRGNSFLDRINQDLLEPRGLYAMVMAFKDDVPAGKQSGPLSSLSKKIGHTFFSTEKEELDIYQTAEKYRNPKPDMSAISKGLSNMRLTSGTTQGQLALPESAPLIYPHIDKAVVQVLQEQGDGKGEQTGMKEKFSSAGQWVNEYLDGRASAFYEAENPGSTLVASSENRTTMKSRFNDPNHAANSGSLVALLSGGHVTKPERGRGGGLLGRRGRGSERRGGSLLPGGRPQSHGKPGEGLVKKVMQRDVLYLLIVNIPTEQEIQQSVADLEAMVG